MIAPDAKTGALIYSSLVAVPQELSNSLENKGLGVGNQGLEKC
jgi:hypothetical protein